MPRAPLSHQGGIEFMAKPLLIPPGEESRPGRTAIGTRDITAGAANALLRQGIDVRRSNFLAAVDAEVGIAKIVHQDDENIWPARWLVLGRCGADGKEGTNDPSKQQSPR